jgi:hypothetical protein
MTIHYYMGYLQRNRKIRKLRTETEIRSLMTTSTNEFHQVMKNEDQLFPRYCSGKVLVRSDRKWYSYQ